MKEDEGLYVSTIYIAWYVDDILVFCKDQANYIDVKRSLQEKYLLKDLGPVSSFFNLSIQKTSKYWRLVVKSV